MENPLEDGLARAIVPTNPFAPRAVSFTVVLLPDGIVNAEAEAESVKLGAGVTVTVTGNEDVSDPLTPFRVSV